MLTPLPARPPIPAQPSTEQTELEASMARHPAGKARLLSTCPTCGQNASGALGATENVLI